MRVACRRLGVLFILVCQPGCSVDAEAPTVHGKILDRPQALIFVSGKLVVANTGFGTPWRPGSLTVFEPTTGRVVNTIKTTHLNPQTLVRRGEWLYVVNTGTFDFSQFDSPRSDQPGNIDRIALNSLTAPEPIIEAIELDDRFSAPVDLSFVNGRALVTSGLTRRVLLSASERTWRGQEIRSLGPEGAIGLGQVQVWRDLFLVVDFNTDRLFALTETGETLCELDVGEQPDLMEGATAPVVDGDALYVMLALSGAVRRVDLAALPEDCRPVIETVIAPLGETPNHLRIADDALLVVHSGDNNVIAYHKRTGMERERWALPIGSNPWQVALSEDGEWMAVTEWASNAVTLVNRRSGETRRLTDR